MGFLGAPSFCSAQGLAMNRTYLFYYDCLELNSTEQTDQYLELYSTEQTDQYLELK